jgi:DNA-binding transcriptional LysR family regulator
VYQQVQRLGEEIGVELFERVGKDRVIPTPAGAALYDHVAPFLEQLPAVVRDIGEQRHGGTLRVNASPLVLRHLLPRWISRARRERPEIGFAIEETGAADLQLLAGGRTDVLIDYLPELPAGLGSRRVGTVRGFLVVPRDHRICRRRKLDLGLLAPETLVAYHPSLGQHALQRRALERLDLEPAATIHASTAGTILSLVEAGLGYSCVPSLAAAGPRHRGVRAFALGRFFDADLPLHAVWRSSADGNPLLRSFLKAAPRVEPR